jgi:hypothetical protein
VDNRSSTRTIVYEQIDRRPENYTTQYLRRLIAERAYIRAALYNHGGSIITHGSSLDLEGQDVYTSQIGNDFHLDLVEAEKIIAHDMSQQQRDTLMEWSLGVDERTANDLVRATNEPRSRVIHMRRKRAIARLTEKMQDGELGGGGGTTSETVREPEGNQSS